ncbi:MAG: hypothetical protein EXR98_06780 [Gemmataceae bacterium]|nr:hypothetical protein [Gemmataceae bacterium]
MKRFSLIVIGCLLPALSADAGEPAVKQTIKYVQNLQTATGGFRPFDVKDEAIEVLPTLRATSAAMRALKYFGGDLPNKDLCAKFVESCYDAESGGFADMPKVKPDVFSTAVGLMATDSKNHGKYASGAIKYFNANARSFEEIRIAVAGLETIAEKSPKYADWIKEVTKLQNEDGTFGKSPGLARATGGSVVALLRMGAKPADSERVLKVIKDGQRRNGGWGKEDSAIASDLETTYRVMRCFVMLKSRPDNVEGVRSFVAKCRNADGGYAVAPGQPSNISGTYFAAIILHWLK